MFLASLWMRTRLLAVGRSARSSSLRLGFGAVLLTAAPSAHGDAVQVWSLQEKTKVYSRPSKRSKPLGYLAVGSSARALPKPPIAGPGCAEGFVSVLPYGYACSLELTQALDDPKLKRRQRLSPAPGAHPYRYAFSNGAPIYGTLPSPAEWQQREQGLGAAGSFKPLAWHWRHEVLARSKQLQPTAPLGSFEIGPSPQRFAPYGVLIAFRDVFQANGRSWLLTAGGSAVPADRVRPFDESEFQGLELQGGAQLPVAWLKSKARLYQRTADSEFTPAEVAPRHGALTLTGIRAGDYHQTRVLSSSGASLWLKESDDVGVATRSKRPSFVGPNERWIHVRVTAGVLVAYQGDTPVFTTLISPGRGGLSVRGRSNAANVEASTTPLGGFRIQHKYRVHTMSPDKPLPPSNWKQWIEQVQFTQFFDVPFALHTTYWHDDFGKMMSNGCINLSPRDAERLFEWTAPTLPPGWGGIYQDKRHGRGTWVVIRR